MFAETTDFPRKARLCVKMSNWQKINHTSQMLNDRTMHVENRSQQIQGHPFCVWFQVLVRSQYLQAQYHKHRLKRKKAMIMIIIMRINISIQALDIIPSFCGQAENVDVVILRMIFNRIDQVWVFFSLIFFTPQYFSMQRSFNSQDTQKIPVLGSLVGVNVI